MLSGEEEEEEEEMQLMKDSEDKVAEDAMSAVAQQARPWGTAWSVGFDFFCEDGFLVVFCCHLLPLLSPACR